MAGEDNRASANARLIHAAAPGSRFPRGKCPNKVPPVPLFSVIVREHAYTGQFYHDVVEAGSCEQALHRATAPQLPPGSRQRSFSVTVTEHTYATSAGRFQDDFVEAGSCEQALHLAAARATAPQPPPGSGPQPGNAGHRRCADVWVHSLLHCELEQGHDPPHTAAAPGYCRPARWVRDDRGLAHAVPGPGTGPGTRS